MIVVIPDVHGEYRMLQAAMDIINRKYPTPLIVFLGDLCDRGSDTFACMNLARSLLVAKRARFILGNHEEMFLEGIHAMQQQRSLPGMWLNENAGGHATLRNYSDVAGSTLTTGILRVLKEHGHIEMLEQAEPYVEIGNLILTHAPLPRYTRDNWRERDPVDHSDAWGGLLRWSFPGQLAREPDFSKDHGPGKLGICGHVTWVRHGMPGPRYYAGQIYLDGGCGKDPKGTLTCLVIDEDTTVIHDTITIHHPKAYQ